MTGQQKDNAESLGEIGLKSKRLARGVLLSALNIAIHGVAPSTAPSNNQVDVRMAVRAFKKELLALDKINPRPDVFLSGVLAGALVLLSLHTESLAFFEALNAASPRDGDNRNPIVALRIRISEFLAHDEVDWQSAQETLCGLTFHAFELWSQHGEATRSEYALVALPLDERIAALRGRRDLSAFD